MNDQNNTGIGNQVPNPNNNVMMGTTPSPNNNNMMGTTPSPNPNNMMGTTPSPNNNVMMGTTPNPNNNVMMGTTPSPNNNNMMGTTPSPNPNNMMGGAANPNAPKKNNVTIIIIAVVAVIVIGTILLFVFKDKKSKPVVEVEHKIEESIKLEEKITVKGEKLPNGKIFLTVKNNNNTAVSVKVSVNFYDKNNNLINIEESYIDPIKSNSEKHGQIYLSSSERKYDKFELKFKAEDCSLKEFIDNDKLEIKNSINKESEEILLQVKNNSGSPVGHLDIETIFYKDNKVIEYSENYIDEIRINETGIEKIRIPYDANYEKIKYDNIKIFVYAYNTDFDY